MKPPLALFYALLTFLVSPLWADEKASATPEKPIPSDEARVDFNLTSDPDARESAVVCVTLPHRSENMPEGAVVNVEVCSSKRDHTLEISYIVTPCFAVTVADNSRLTPEGNYFFKVFKTPDKTVATHQATALTTAGVKASIEDIGVCKQTFLAASRELTPGPVERFIVTPVPSI